MLRAHFPKIEILIKILLFGIIVYFTLFNHLDKQVIRLWDESRVAINAYEMNKTGFSIVTTYGYKPDMWNVKPPLLIWLQTACMKILGTTETAVRLPAAIGAFLTCCLLMWLGIRHFKSYWFGLFSVVVLVSSKGFVFEHAARTGEYDGLMVFFTTFYAICFFLYLELKDEAARKKYLTLTFVGLTLAVMTKGIAGLLITPGILLYMVIRKQLLPTLKRKQSYIHLAIFLGVVFGYYFLREQYTPTYMATVWQEELAGRYADRGDPNVHPWWYFNRFININFVNWYPLLVVGVIVGLLNKNTLIQQLVGYCLMVSVPFLILISNGGTQLQWYDMPMYPFLAIIVGALLAWMAERLNQNELIFKKYNLSFISYLIILMILFPYYRQIVKEVTYMPDKEDDSKYDVTYYLRSAFEERRNVEGYSYVSTNYDAHNQFYLLKLRDEKNSTISNKGHKDLETGDKVIVDQDDLKDYITTHYDTHTLEEYKTVRVYEIKGKKANGNIHNNSDL
jgi:4-amino-4-deoxy-L-arabinose transferase-like glycosyltransferase